MMILSYGVPNAMWLRDNCNFDYILRSALTRSSWRIFLRVLSRVVLPAYVEPQTTLEYLPRGRFDFKCLLLLQGEKESGAFIHLGLSPNFSSMTADNPLCERQSNASSFKLIGAV
jgi:hypothetical protein